MRQSYIDELEELKIKMEKAEAFALTLPVFEEIIIRNKLSGEEPHICFGRYYKSIPLEWGLNRIYYGLDEKPLNWEGTYFNCHLTKIYINSCSLFGTGNIFGVEKIPADCYSFFDDSSTTFYATDAKLPLLLEALHDWYEKSRILAEQFHKEEKIAKLKKELAALQPPA